MALSQVDGVQGNDKMLTEVVVAGLLLQITS